MLLGNGRAAGRQAAFWRRKTPWQQRCDCPAAGSWAMVGGLVTADGWRALDGELLILIDLLLLLVADWPNFCFSLPGTCGTPLSKMKGEVGCEALSPFFLNTIESF